MAPVLSAPHAQTSIFSSFHFPHCQVMQGQAFFGVPQLIA
jgi:hypothetical protein